MLKKIAIVAMTLALCISMTACSSDGKKHMELKNAQDTVLNLESGKITVISQIEDDNKSDTIKSELVFKTNPDGVISYCQMQYDLNNKPVYCEFSDGEKSEQWLVGRGWSVLDTMQYTKDNPHRYTKLLSTSFDKKSIDNIICDETETAKTYTMELDPKVLNKTTYKDSGIEIISQSVTMLVNANNELVRYNDTSKVLDKSTDTQSLYMLEMALSEQNAIKEVIRPELRDYAVKK
ncbi:MAG: hypothetical protein RR444_08250 [Oscillospiraceae bacterium]